MYKQDHWVKAISKIWTSNYWWAPEPGQRTARAQTLFLSSDVAEGNPFPPSAVAVVWLSALAPCYKTVRGVVPIPAGLQGWWYPGPSILGDGGMSWGAWHLHSAQCWNRCQCWSGVSACRMWAEIPAPGLRYQLLDWGSALTEAASENGRFMCCVKKDVLLPEWQSAVL